ncbi:MAG: hypothetical protein K2Q34_05265 [Alphaproteobacteria bacterium]|nr:hypothetical protein [Alphaproteobacteria bacterium]
MKNFKIHKLVPFIVTTVIFSYFIFFNMQRKTILILHSYHPEYSWVRDVNEGIKRVLKDQSFVNVRWHYMDTKNHPDEPFKEKAGAIARKVIDFVRPDVLIPVDDDAQKYAAQFYKDTPGINIVHAGINAPLEKYGYEKAKNVVGILERIPIKGVKDAILAFAKERGMDGPIRVAHVSDNSFVVQSDDHNMHASKDWAPLIFGKSFLVETFDEWKKAILEADQHMDFMIVSNYRKITRSKTDPKLVPFKEVMKWAFENSPVPIIGINGFVCEDGAAISIATSPFEQGEVAMQMALDLASGDKEMKDLETTQTQQYIVIMDESRFKASGIQLPSVYQSFARAINKFFVQKKNIKS